MLLVAATINNNRCQYQEYLKFTVSIINIYCYFIVKIALCLRLFIALSVKLD